MYRVFVDGIAMSIHRMHQQASCSRSSLKDSEWSPREATWTPQEQLARAFGHVCLLPLLTGLGVPLLGQRRGAGGSASNTA